MLVADVFAQQLKANGIEKLFVYPGGTIAPLVVACMEIGIGYECFKSEQGAGYAALAWSRLTNNPQVVLVTSGPGATNLVTPIADAFYDSTPLIVVTGQVSTMDLSARKAVRQRGFQETNTVEITKSISKRSICVMGAREAVEEIGKAFDFATTGRKGPVVIDFPMNIQKTEVDFEVKIIPFFKKREIILDPNSFDKNELQRLLSKSKKIVLLLGHGALESGCFDEFVDIAEQLDALVACSFLGMGAYDTNDARFVGYIGHTGHQAANTAVHHADLVVVLGSRLDVRQTGTLVDQFVPNGKVIWIESDTDELAHPRVRIDVKVKSTVEEFIPHLVEILPTVQKTSDLNWRKHIFSIKNAKMEDMDYSNNATIYPRPILNQLSEQIASQDYIVVTGVGCHQHWAARHIPLGPKHRRLLTSGGHGTMGYDLPSAIGAALSDPSKLILCIVGDGSLLMNVQELASLVKRQLNVKIVIMNNLRLGIVSQFQKMNWGNDPMTGDFEEIAFAKVGEAFGIKSKRLENPKEITKSVRWLLSDKKPRILEVMIDSKADILPMLLAGQKMDEMWQGYQE